jgi:hypothetical protein
MFYSNLFAVSALANFDYLWGALPRTEPDIAAMKDELALQLRFYDLIRLRAGEKLKLVDFVAIGLSGDSLMALIHLMMIKQPNCIYYDYNTPGEEFISYQPQRMAMA